MEATNINNATRACSVYMTISHHNSYGQTPRLIFLRCVWIVQIFNFGWLYYFSSCGLHKHLKMFYSHYHDEGSHVHYIESCLGYKFTPQEISSSNEDRIRDRSPSVWIQTTITDRIDAYPNSSRKRRVFYWCTCLIYREPIVYGSHDSYMNYVILLNTDLKKKQKKLIHLECELGIQISLPIGSTK